MCITYINKSESPIYNEAQELKEKADSLGKVLDEKVKLKREEIEKKRIENQILKNENQLKKELKSINDGVDFSTYRGTVINLQMEIALFGAWATIIEENKSSKNLKVKKLSNQLKSKVSRIQVKEFPILRKEYAKIVANEMWENDINVHANGTGKKYLNFTGGIFAANKNKQDFQNQVHEVLMMFRYKQARYKWDKGQDEYTYYAIYKGKDSDPVTFTK
jgi:hypothetical protein